MAQDVVYLSVRLTNDVVLLVEITILAAANACKVLHSSSSSSSFSCEYPFDHSYHAYCVPSSRTPQIATKTQSVELVPLFETALEQLLRLPL